ncbi:hypothetical protein SteCoe_19987 [Stentor coeruleus]|uniref:Uncharacterized protein n=1 Tax=Stentor coeruleus TaxID=5963 RepID=A0A1R2BT16_9CILI|nr:hypothetical protein SteCoe_19987 [Stentor coeruleus]
MSFYENLYRKELIPGVKKPGTAEKEFYFEYIRDFARLDKRVQEMLIDRAYEIYSTSFKGLDKNSFADSEFYDPIAVCIKLLLLKTRNDNIIQGFATVALYEFYALPNNFSLSNKYLISNGIVCLSTSYKGKGALKDINITCAHLLVDEYNQGNFIHIDVSSNPITYYAMCKIGKFIVPMYQRVYSEDIEKFMIRFIRKLGYERVEGKNNLVVRDTYGALGIDKRLFLDNLDKLPEEMKYFIGLTGLEDNVGLCFLSAYRAIQGNSLGIPQTDYKSFPDLDAVAYQWVLDSNRPRL